MEIRDLSGIYPFLWAAAIGAGGYIIYIIWKYAKGLEQSPRELWFVSLSQLIEFIAYSLMNITIVLFLSSDLGMSDVSAGNYVAAWTLGITATMFLVGALVDAIGVKKVLLAGTILAVLSRMFLAVNTNIYVLTFLAFIPQALSIALAGPVITVAIKRYTHKETSAMGFALFYTLMNIGYAAGGWTFDKIRAIFGEYGNITVPLLGEMSTYRLILLTSFILTIPTYILIKIMREGVSLKDDGTLEINPAAERQQGNIITASYRATSKAFADAFVIFKTVARQPHFWRFMGLLAMLLGVNYVFYHFHYTFPKYGIRVLGEGAKVGTLYGVLNPVIIVFFVPLIAWATRKMNPYRVITIGTFVSALSVFIITLPPAFFMPLVDTTFGRLIWQEWLGVAVSTDPNVLALYIAIFFFVGFFTIGEAIWSPRLMEYTARIAPVGQEGSYMSLSLLPKFLAQPLVGYMSGKLLAAYVPMVDSVDSSGHTIINEAGKAVQTVGDTSHHYMIWVWVGTIALISPIGMLIFKKYIGGEKTD